MQKVVNGLLLLDKARGMSSNYAMQQVKRLYKTRDINLKKIGHTGSLDPLASGVLPLCLGEATKFADYLLQADKTYYVEALLGQKTTTGDIEGEIIQEVTDFHITMADVERILPRFIGNLTQVPPMFSALKLDGTPLYKLARRGITVARAPRNITVYNLECLFFDGRILKLVATVSKGTYIRTLIEDIGDSLEVGAHVTTLRRRAVAGFAENRAISFSALQESTDIEQYLLPIDKCLELYPCIYLPEKLDFYIKRGQAVSIPDVSLAGLLRLYDANGLFLGLGHVLDDGRIAPKRLCCYG